KECCMPGCGIRQLLPPLQRKAWRGENDKGRRTKREDDNYDQGRCEEDQHSDRIRPKPASTGGQKWLRNCMDYRLNGNHHGVQKPPYFIKSAGFGAKLSTRRLNRRGGPNHF